jgi:hypothetical protein
MRVVLIGPIASLSAKLFIVEATRGEYMLERIPNTKFLSTAPCGD